MQKLGDNSYAKFGRKREKLAGNPNSPKVDRTISLTFVLLFITFTLTWYMYVSASSAFDAIVRISDHIASNIFTEFLNPEVAQGLGIIMTETVSPLHSVTKYLHFLSQFFIFVGVITLMLNRKGLQFEREYEAFCLVNFVIFFAGIVVPYFASLLNITRLYQITFIFLAPFCVIGGITVFRMVSRVARASWTGKHVRSSLKVLSVFFAIFLLFNSGWVYEVAKDNPTSISLNNTINFPRFNDQEVLSAKWLYTVKSSNPIHADGYRWLLLGSFNWEQARGLPKDVNKISDESYVYLVVTI